MRFPVVAFAIVLLCAAAHVATAGVTVSAIDTLATANAYAPFDKSSYYVTDDKPNVSPAVAEVSGDWTGTNAGGAVQTWHMTTSSHASSATSLTQNTLSITGDGSFSYHISTSAGFVEPTSADGVYGPGAVA